MKFNEAKKIKEDQKRLEEVFKKMSSVAGTIAQNHFIMSFRNQGFTDEVIAKWKARKKPDAGRAILVKSGALRRSIKMKKVGLFKIVMSSNIPYAQIHNDGGIIKKGKGKVRMNWNEDGKLQRQRTARQRAKTAYYTVHKYGKHTITMPKRQFIGNSSMLNKKIIANFQSQIDKVFK